MKTRYFFATMFIVLFLTSCTIYTEKRSQALSRAVAATADSIESARFDLALKYSKEAVRVAYPPKNRIKIDSILTSEKDSVESTSFKTRAESEDEKFLFDSNLIKIKNDKKNEQMILRLVVPEKFKNAKLLIENSEEWQKLLETKEFAEQLEIDNKNLKKVQSEIEKELLKQTQMNSKMIEDLNSLQKAVLAKDLHILKLYIVIFILIATMGGATYLRIKGIL